MSLRERLGSTRRLASFERRVVWMLGSPRTGTTWLLNLLQRQPHVMKIDEPGIGVHLGLFLHEFYGSPAGNFPPGRSLMTEIRAGDYDYFFADTYADAWRPHLRRLILERFAAQARRQQEETAFCLVKEPNGSQAARMLLETLPSSRLMWVLRDGRDVVDSKLDGILPGGWMGEHAATWAMTPEERLRYVEDRSYRWLRRTEHCQRAFGEADPGQRLLVRYEELRAQTADELARIHAWLGVPVAREEAAAAAEALSFEALPAEQRGRGKFTRSATAGGWRTNLSAEEQAVMWRVMGDKLSELGYE